MPVLITAETIKTALADLDQESVKGLSPWLNDHSYRIVRCTVYRFHALMATK